MNQMIQQQNMDLLAPFLAAKEQIQLFARQCQHIIVINEETLSTAKEYSKKSKALIDTIEKTRKELTRPLDEEKKRIMDVSKDLTKDVDAANQVLRNQILKYEREKEAKRLEEVRKFEEEQERIRQAELERAKAMQAENGTGTLPPLPIPRANIEIPAAKSKDIKYVWTYKVAAHELVPLEYMMIDDARIKLAIKQGIREIPGIQIFQEQQLSLR